MFAVDSRWMGRTSTMAVAHCASTSPSCRNSMSSLTMTRVGTTPTPICRLATLSRHHLRILEMAFLDHLVAQVHMHHVCFSIYRITGWAKNGPFLKVCNSSVWWDRKVLHISVFSSLSGVRLLFWMLPGPKFTDDLRTVLRQFSDLRQSCDNCRIHRTFTTVLRPIF